MSLINVLNAIGILQQGGQKYSAQRKALWEATEPPEGAREIDPTRIAQAISTGKIDKIAAGSLLVDPKTFELETYGAGADQLRHATLISTLRYLQLSGRPDSAARYGYRNALQGLIVPHDKAMFAFGKQAGLNSDLGIFTDSLIRSEGTQHWKGNVTEYAEFLQGYKGTINAAINAARNAQASRTAALLDYTTRDFTPPQSQVLLLKKTPKEAHKHSLDMLADSIDNLAALEQTLLATAALLEKSAADSRMETAAQLAELRAKHFSLGRLYDLDDYERVAKEKEQGRLDADALQQHNSRSMALAEWMRKTAIATREVAANHPNLGQAAAQPQEEPAEQPRPHPAGVNYEDTEDILRKHYDRTDLDGLWKNLQNSLRRSREILGSNPPPGPVRSNAEANIDYVYAMKLKLEGTKKHDYTDGLFWENRHRIENAIERGETTVKLIPPLSTRTLDGWAGEEKVTIGTARAARPDEPAPQAQLQQPAVTPETMREQAQGAKPVEAEGRLKALVEGIGYKQPGSKELYAGINAAIQASHPAMQTTPDKWGDIRIALTEAAKGDKKLSGSINLDKIPAAKAVVLSRLGFTPEMLGQPLDQFSLYKMNATERSKLVKLMPSASVVAVNLHKLLNEKRVVGDSVRFGTGEGVSVQELEHVVNELVNPFRGGLIELIIQRDMSAPSTTKQPAANTVAPPNSVPPPAKQSRLLQHLDLGAGSLEELDEAAERLLTANVGSLIPANVHSVTEIDDTKPEGVIDADSAIVGVCGYDQDGTQYCADLHVRLAGVTGAEAKEKRGTAATETFTNMLLGMQKLRIMLNPRDTGEGPGSAKYSRWAGVLVGEDANGQPVEINVDLQKSFDAAGLAGKRYAQDYGYDPLPAGLVEESLRGGSADDDFGGRVTSVPKTTRPAAVANPDYWNMSQQEKALLDAEYKTRIHPTGRRLLPKLPPGVTVGTLPIRGYEP